MAPQTTGLRCPKCGDMAPKPCFDSRKEPEGAQIRRRRGCSKCGHRFNTYEVHEELLQMIEQIRDMPPAAFARLLDLGRTARHLRELLTEML